MSSTAKSSAVTNGKTPQRGRKRKKPSSPATETEPTSVSIMSLPYDLLLNCFARLSRLYYPTLSLVSKHFRSIIASQELYETRSRLNRTEKCLYLCLHFYFDYHTYWFTLSRQPNRKVTNNESSGKHLMVEIPPPNARLHVQSSSLVAVGSDQIKIGKSPKSSLVSVLDCRTHKWRQAPNMRVKRNCTSTVTLVDGKIYVAGGCKDKTCFSDDFIEVYDPKTKTWGTVKNPSVVMLDEYGNRRGVVKSFSLGGKLYMFGSDYVVYNPNKEEGIWNAIGRKDTQMGHAVDLKTCEKSNSCVTYDVLFTWYSSKGKFKWYDFKVSEWKELKGLEGLPDFTNRGFCKMVDLGGKMAVLWDENFSIDENRIWCAQICLERRHGDEIWGNVEWVDYVLRVHSSCCFSSADALSVLL